MAQPLLSGEQEYVEHADDSRIPALEAQVRELRRQLSHAELEARHAKEDIEQTVRKLRDMTAPFFQILRALHGEINAIGVSEAPASQGNDKWEFWKKRFGGRIAETIDLLLIQGQMNSSQLKSALKCDPRTLAKSVIYPLNNAGLLVKNGGMFSLKQL